MKKLVKVVAVALVLATLCMNASTVMAAPVNGAAHASANSRVGGQGLFAAIWAAIWGGHAAIWGGHAAIWGGHAAIWGGR